MELDSWRLPGGYPNKVIQLVTWPQNLQQIERDPMHQDPHHSVVRDAVALPLANRHICDMPCLKA